MRSRSGLRVVYVDNFPGSTSPARVWRDDGIIEINRSRWVTLPESYRDYILAHEEGHYALDTSDEFAADEYAFRKLAGKKPFSIKNTVRAINDVLPGRTREQRQRMDAAILRALKYDAIENHNNEARKMYMEMTGKDPDSFFGKKRDYWIIIVAVVIVVAILIFKK